MRVGNRGRIDIDADDAIRNGSQQCTAITLTACHIENPLTGNESACKCIAMPMLECNLAGLSGDETFAGEFEGILHDWSRRSGIGPAPRCNLS